MALCKRLLLRLSPTATVFSLVSVTKKKLLRRNYSALPPIVVSDAEKLLHVDASHLMTFKSCNNSISFNNNNTQFSHLSNPSTTQASRAFLVDTLALVRNLEAQGLPSKQAEAITAAITEVLNDSLENVAHSFVSKEEMQKSVMAQEADLSKFESEVKNSQDHQFSSLNRETEKLRNDIDKMRNELRYEIDKVTAGQRLDLNLERGRIRDELANQNKETTNLTNKLDREIHTLRAQSESANIEVIKYCVGTLISIFAVGIAVLRTISQR